MVHNCLFICFVLVKDDQNTTMNSHEITQEMNNIQASKYNKIIILGIKDLHVNLPIQNILHITKFSLNKYNNITVFSGL